MAQNSNSKDFLLDLQVQISVLTLVATALVSRSPDREELVSTIRQLADQVKSNTDWPDDADMEGRIDTYLSAIIG
jgi:TorA maturation chaperone TorD